MFDFQLEFESAITQVAVRSGGLLEIGAALGSLPGIEAGIAVVITDERVGALYAEGVLESLGGHGWTTLEQRIPPGEGSKTLAQAHRIYDFLASSRVGRDATLIALGGGVVSDLTGFVAGTWMRGVRFVICPTTLESAVDACLGGKTGVNLPAGKNLVGVFHQPAAILVDPRCLCTLEKRDVAAGLAESVKHALIRSEEFLSWHEDHAAAMLSLEEEVIRELILRNLRIKGDIVQKDTLEKSGQRMLLNLGHTVGHAIETCCGYSLRHGECVGLGMLAACRLSELQVGLDGETTARVTRLLQRVGLPTKLTDPVEADRIIECVRMDKKARGGQVQFVLLEAVGRPVICADIPESWVRQAYASIVA